MAEDQVVVGDEVEEPDVQLLGIVALRISSKGDKTPLILCELQLRKDKAAITLRR